MMAAKKKSAAPVELPEEKPAADDPAFPYAVASPYLAGWSDALTKKYGTRGKAWTSTKSEPQWTVRFKDSEAAAWFKDSWVAGAA
jgi:hypothetical protein